jgi:hypothetical protein
MPQINFKKQFADAIRQGTKTTTLRRWKTCKLSPGDRAYSMGIGWLRIRAAEPIELSALKEADARTDGFESLVELRAMLKRLYPDQRGDGKRWYRIAFDLAEAKPRASIAKPRKRLGSGAKARLARRIRAELDKAVRRSGLLFPL